MTTAEKTFNTPRTGVKYPDEMKHRTLVIPVHGGYVPVCDVHNWVGNRKGTWNKADADRTAHLHS